ncbi:MAG TPA: autotransporter-associated beta strand repeat-containing protein, partial [Pirellulales bacterium]|nr:autotransporter-associated beta strand repeat-containing protein [Pirellulales bacterium]
MLLAPYAQASIAVVDPSQSFVLTNNSAGNDTAFNQSFNYTVSAGANVLIVDYAAFVQTPATSNPLTTITWNGVPLTATTVQVTTNVTTVDTQVFYLFNPTPGGAGSLVVSGSNRGGALGAFTLSGVDTAAAPTILGTTNGTTTTGTISVATPSTTIAGSFATVVEADRAGGAYTTTDSATSGTNSVVTQTFNSIHDPGAYMSVGGATISNMAAGAQTITWTNGTSTNRNAISVAIFNPLLAVGTIWTGVNSSDWNDGTNWNPNGVPTGVTVTFGSTSANPIVDLGNTNQSVSGVVFVSAVNTTIGSVAATKLVLDNGASPVAVAVNGGNHIINAGVTLNSNATITGNGGSLTLNNVIGEGALGKAVTFAGTGNFNLNAVNTYTGGTNINGGTIQTVAGGLGTTGNITFGGGQLQYATTTSPLDISSRLVNSTGAIKIDLNGNTATYASAINSSNTGGLNLSSTAAGGVVNLNGANSYTGATTIGQNVTVNLNNANALPNNALAINGGTLDLNANSATVSALSGTGGAITDNSSSPGSTTLTVNQSTNTTFAGTIGGGATRTIGLTKSGTGSLTLTGQVNLGSNVPFLSGGTLNLANNNNSIGAGPIVVSSGNTLGAGSGFAASSNALSSATVHLTGGTLSLNAGSTAVSGFGGNGTGWTLNGGPTVTGDVATVTTAAGSEARSLYYNTKESITNFNASFIYTNTTGTADGVTFILQNSGLTALGTSGGGFGYTGITPSAAVILNIYSGAAGGRGTNFSTNGTIPSNVATGTVDLQGGHPISVALAYNGTTLTETLTDTTAPANTFTTSYNVDLATALGGTTAYLGFTGGTGGESANQTISNFAFSAGSASVLYNNNVIVDTADSTISSPNGSSTVASLTLNPNLVLNVTGKVRATTTTFTGTGGNTYTFNVAAAGEYDVTQPLNTNNIVTINKTGAGILALDYTAGSSFTNAATKFNVTGGTLALVGLNGDPQANPLGAAKIQLGTGSNVTLALSSKGGNVDFDNVPVTVLDSATITAGQYASGIAGIPQAVAYVAPTLAANFNATNGLALASGKTLTLNSTNAYLLNMAGVISEIGGSANLAVNGGWVNFSATNTTTGTVTVTAGTLGWNNATALSSASSIAVSGTGTLDALAANSNLAKVSIATGATLRLSADQATGVAPTAAIAGILSLNADISAGFNTTIASGGTIRSIGTAHSLGSNVALQGGSVNFGGTGNANNLTITGNVINGTSAGGVTVNGTGTFTLNGNNTYTGATAVNSGTLAVGPNGLAGTSGVTIGGQGSNAALSSAGPIAAAITVNKQGTFTGSGAGSAGAGGLNVNSGAIANLTGNGAAAGGAIVVNAGTLNVSAAGGIQTPTSVTVGGAAGTTSILNGAAGVGNTTTINQNVSVTNGTIHASSGTLSFGSHTVTGVPSTFSAGLLEGQISNNAFDETSANPGGAVQLGPVRAQSTDTTLFPNNTTFVYSGQVLVPNNNGDGTGSIALAENFDDSVLIKIDGVQKDRDTVYNSPTSTGKLTLSAGWHNIEIRLGQGGGGVGPNAVAGGWDTTIGVGIEIPANGMTATFDAAGAGAIRANYVIPLDSGSMNLFRVATATSSVIVDAGATAQAASFSNFENITLNGGATAASPATLTLSDNAVSTTSSTNTLTVAGATTPFAVINVGQNNTLTANSLSLAAGSNLTINGTATSTVTLSSPNSWGGTNAVVNLNGGRLNYNSSDSGPISGTLNVNSGSTLAGTGTINASVNLGSGATLTPGGFSGATVIPLSLGAGNSLTLNAGAVLAYDLSNTNQGTSHGSPGSTNLLALGTGGSLLFPSGGSVTLNLLGAVPTVTQGTTAYYELFSYTSPGAVSNFVDQMNFSFASQNPSGSIQLGAAFSSAPSSYTYSLVNDMATNGVYLDITNAAASTANGTWTGNVDATWQNDGNWNPAKPSGAGAAAIFSGASSGSPIILGQDRTIGSLQLSGADYTIGSNATSSLILDNTGGSGNATITASSGAQLILAPVLVSNTNLDISESFGSLELRGGLTVSSGKTANLIESNSASLTVGDVVNNGTLNAATGTTTVGNVTGSGSTTVANNAKLTAKQFVQGSLTVHGDSTHTTAKATVTTSGANSAGDPNQVSVLNSLSIDNDGGALGSRNYYGTVDLKNNDIIINN